MLRPAVASFLISIIFIARTTFVVDGVRYATLFDDAMISMRYARNLARGYGLVWNVGQPPVEGYSNLLWTLWMALLHLVPVSEAKIAFLVMFTGVAILIGTLAIVRSIAQRVAPASPVVASSAVWMTALYYPLIYWTLRGMEVGLVTLILSASVLFALKLHDHYRRADLIALAVVMALGVLTRADALVPCLIVALSVLLASPRGDRMTIVAVLGCSVVGTLALHTGFRWRYYGDLLPNTYYLKVAGASIGTRLARGLAVLVGTVVVHLSVPVALALGYLVACWRHLSVSARDLHGRLLLGAVVAAVCGYSAYVGGDAWEGMFYANRYLTPAMPALLILSALAIDQVVGSVTELGAVVFAVVALFLAVGALTAVLPSATLGLDATAADVRLRVIRALMTCAAGAALPLIARSRALAATTLTAGAIVAVSGLGFSMWLNHNAFYVGDDAWATRYGLALRAATADEASLAVTWGGAIPYFSGRPAIDLLGKSDRVIALALRQEREGFNPGHDKWDYGYSIGHLRPDVVAQLWHATDDEVRAIVDAGYVQLAPWAFTRNDSAHVDKAAVHRAACAVFANDPFLLGSATRVPDNLTALANRYCHDGAGGVGFQNSR